LFISNKDGKQLISASLVVEILGSEKDTIINKSYSFKNVIDTSLHDDQNTLVGVISYVVNNGNYKLKVGGVDNFQENHEKFFTENLIVKPYLLSEPSVSNIELATSIKNNGVSKESIFYKNSFEIYPNPAVLYSEKMPVIYFYSELYGLKDTSENKLKLNKMVLNSKGQTVYKKSKKLSNKSNSIVDVGFINMKKLPTDTYTLMLGIASEKADVGKVSSKKFFFYNPSVEDTTNYSKKNISYMDTEFGVLSDEECDAEFDVCMYIATSKDVKQYDQLTDVAAKRKFLYNFWTPKDTNPYTPGNEYRTEFMIRKDFADNKYSYLGKKGWKTDRGRVLMVYGQPDEIDRNPSETGTNPYETWVYQSIEGGVIFIFGDVTSYGNFELLHSTKRGEIVDPNWMRRLSKY